MVVDSDGRLVVASSNSDLLYDESTGGTLASLAVTLEPSEVVTVRDVNVRSFAGDLALARTEARGPAVPDAEACGGLTPGIPGPLAIFGTRGSNTLNVLSVDPATGAPSCSGPGAGCQLPIGKGFADPLPVSVACGGGHARAFVGYLTAANAEAFIGQIDLDEPGLPLTNIFVGFGPIRGFAYDRDRDRLYMVGLATGSPTPLRWIDLAGCSLAAPIGAGGCRQSAAFLPSVPPGLELRSMAFAHVAPPGVQARAYLTARLYDVGAAATAGFRNTDFGGLILVVDLVENAAGGVDPQVVSAVPIGIGAQDIRVLPRAPGWAATRRDVVAALTVNEGALWIYDDETGSVQAFRQCSTAETCSPVTGAPLLGQEPYGLAVDPALSGNTARLWVGSYAESFITPIDVTLIDPEPVATFAGGFHHRISGGAP
jgi:hypothetical protein